MYARFAVWEGRGEARVAAFKGPREGVRGVLVAAKNACEREREDGRGQGKGAGEGRKKRWRIRTWGGRWEGGETHNTGGKEHRKHTPPKSYNYVLATAPVPLSMSWKL